MELEDIIEDLNYDCQFIDSRQPICGRRLTSVG